MCCYRWMLCIRCDREKPFVMKSIVLFQSSIAVVGGGWWWGEESALI